MSLAQRFNQKGNVIILSETTDEPLTLAGQLCGICWGADTTNHERNYKRGLDCLRSGHGRVLEFPQIYMKISGYSARFIRELYTHLAGSPTRLQASTRYVDYNDFDFIVPPKIEKNDEANNIYTDIMQNIGAAAQYMEKELKIPREDAAMILPLGMESTIVMRTNLRMMIDMAKQRKCIRAYHEFRRFFQDFEDALKIYSDEWWYLIEEEHIFKAKCEYLHYCPEHYSCGKAINLETLERYIKEGKERDASISESS